MKKSKILIIAISSLIIFISLTSFLIFYLYSKRDLNKNRTNIYSLSINHDKKARKIAFDALKLEYGDFISDPEEIHAFPYDLNDDGTDEIICIISSLEQRTRWGYVLYILQKQKDNSYKDIGTALGAEAGSIIEILDTKTNGYYDIRMYFANEIPLIIKYYASHGSKVISYSFFTFHKIPEELIPN